MELGMIAIVIAVVFIAYRIGAVKFAQTTSKQGISMTSNMFDLMEEEQIEKQTRKLGKIISKYDDKTITRATLKEVKARRKAGFNATK